MSWKAKALQITRGSPLAWAVVASLAAHLFVIFSHKIDLTPPQDLAKLEARLIRPAPDAKVGQARENDQPPKPPVPRPVPQEAPQTPVAEATEAPAEPPPPVPQTEPEKVVEAKPEPETPPVVEAPKVVGYSWPRAGRIRYLLFGGEGRDPSGSSNAELTWNIDEEGRYRFRLSSQDAKPFPSMPWFTITFSYASQGRLIDGQFRPERYEELISVFQNIVVNFDWEKMQVDFAGHQLPLQPGTMDYLSVIMQSGDPGFVERGMMSVATGRGLRQYRFESSGEESLALPFGMTWKVRQLYGKTGNNDVRVWVATEQFNLPVQIKFVVNKVNYYLIATEVLVAKEALTHGVPAKKTEPQSSTIGQAAPVTEVPKPPMPPAEK